LERVALIGTGAIGSPIARCLVRAGFTTTVYDVRKEEAERLVAMGAKRADRVADCVASDVILIVVADDRQLEDVVAGPDGIFSNLSAAVSPVIVVVSTVSPKTVRDLGEQCRTKGLEIIDAPVSGGHVAAERGNLSVMIGGAKGTFEKMRPVLSAFGRRLYYVGELGDGEIVKLINNMLGVANMWLTMEALATGVSSGLSLDTLLPIVDASSGSNFYIRNWPMGMQVCPVRMLSRLTQIIQKIKMAKRTLKYGVGAAVYILMKPSRQPFCYLFYCCSFCTIVEADQTIIHEPLENAGKILKYWGQPPRCTIKKQPR